jgi:hypothetical protein
MQFFLNGHLVASGTDSSFASGDVGYGDYETVKGAMYYIDYTRLSQTVTLSEAAVGDSVVTFNPHEVTADYVNFAPIR